MRILNVSRDLNQYSNFSLFVRALIVPAAMIVVNLVASVFNGTPVFIQLSVLTLSTLVAFIFARKVPGDGMIMAKMLRSLTLSWVIAAASIFWTIFATCYNLNQNYFGIELLAVVSAIAILALILMFTGEIINDACKYVSDWDDDNVGKQFKRPIIVNRIIFVLIGLLLISELYINFGTQFIWGPTILLSAFFLFTTADSSFKWFDIDARVNKNRAKSRENIIFTTIFSPFAIGAISTFFQFWATIWFILMLVGIAAVIALVVWLVIKKIRKSMKEKEEAEATRVLNEVAAMEEKFNYDKVVAAWSRLKEDGVKEWSDILLVVRNCGLKYDINFNDIIPAIITAPLEQLVTASRVKKQLIWNDELVKAFDLVESIARNSYDDKKLSSIISQHIELNLFIEQFGDYAGYKELAETRKKSFPIISRLVKENNEL